MFIGTAGLRLSVINSQSILTCTDSVGLESRVHAQSVTEIGCVSSFSSFSLKYWSNFTS